MTVQHQQSPHEGHEPQALYTRIPCLTCGGTGHARTLTPYCRACGIYWPDARRFEVALDAADRIGWRFWLFGQTRYRWRTLPCGHDLAACLRYRQAVCYACDGSSYRYQRVAPQRAQTLLAHALATPPQVRSRSRVSGMPTIPPIVSTRGIISQCETSYQRRRSTLS